MRRFSANYLFTNIGKPIRNGIVGVDDNGAVVEVFDPDGDSYELANTEFHNGVIVPGFVNAHCHTELSHLGGKIAQGKGLAGFVEQIRNHRLSFEKPDSECIQKAIDEMYRQGVVAVADICNGADSFSAKINSPIRFANLIELLGLDSQKASFILENGIQLKLSSNIKSGDSIGITPHSVYSLSEKLWELITHELKNSSVVSIHFAESKDERELTENSKGELFKKFIDWGFDIDSIPKGNPVDIVKSYLPKKTNVLFIHNTYIKQDEADELAKHFPNAFFVLCPESNQHIESALPNIEMLIKLGVNIALGTDSLASSSSLSVFNQLKIISQHSPKIPFQLLLLWATLNGAKALGFDKALGSIEIGKIPGLNLISPFDFENMQTRADSRIRKLV
jgi:cytosine/adenosine deaminase-related metal-dependent hydrolase